MAYYSTVVFTLLMIACGPRSEHPSGTCSGRAGISQVGSYTPPMRGDTGWGDAVVSTGDVDWSRNDAGANTADTNPDQQSGDSG